MVQVAVSANSTLASPWAPGCLLQHGGNPLIGGRAFEGLQRAWGRGAGQLAAVLRGREVVAWAAPAPGGVRWGKSYRLFPSKSEQELRIPWVWD